MKYRARVTLNATSSGLHGRPASLVADAVRDLNANASITVSREWGTVELNARSVIDLTGAVAPGETFEVACGGRLYSYLEQAMPIEVFIIIVAVGIAPLVAWGLKGSRAAWAFLVVLLLMTAASAVTLHVTGQLTVRSGFGQVLRIVGVILLAPGILILVITGHEHHSRSGNAPLMPTLEPMAPDLIQKAHFGCVFVVLGGIVLLLSWLLAKVM